MYKSVLFVDLHDNKRLFPQNAQFTPRNNPHLTNNNKSISNNNCANYPVTSSPNIFSDTNTAPRSQSHNQLLRRSSVNSQLSDFENVNETEDDLMNLPENQRSVTPVFIFKELLFRKKTAEWKTLRTLNSRKAMLNAADQNNYLHKNSINQSSRKTISVIWNQNISIFVFQFFYYFKPEKEPK